MLSGVREPKQLFTLAIAALVFLWAGAARAAVMPTFSSMFGDAVTGDTQFKIDGSTDFGWSPNKGADRDAKGYLGRPLIQQFRDLTGSSAAPGKLGGESQLNAKISDAVFGITGSGRSKFQYLDIVQGKLGFDSQFTHFRIELFGEEKVGPGGVRTSRFGANRADRIVISRDAGGAVLSGKAAAFYQTPDWQASEGTTVTKERLAKTIVYENANRGDGSLGGIASSNETPGSLEGLETSTLSDGTIGEERIGYSRRATGQPWVAFAFDYIAYNRQRGTSLDPSDGLPYLASAAHRGPKDTSNYLLTEEAGLAEASSPSVEQGGSGGAYPFASTSACSSSDSGYSCNLLGNVE